MTAPAPIPPVRELPTPQQAAPRPFTWTVERYHDAIAKGLLTENDRVELLFGLLNEKMPVGKRHRDCVDKINVYFVLKFQTRYQYGVQNPLTISGYSEPEPDFLVFNPESYQQREGQPIPEDVHLLIEVSDATLPYDRSTKAKLYALAGIQEYWIVDLRSDQIELHLEPNVEAGEYNNLRRYGADATFESPFCGQVTVKDLLPT